MASCTVCGKRAYSDYCVAHKPRKPIATNPQNHKQAEPCKHCNSRQHFSFQCSKLKLPIEIRDIQKSRVTPIKKQGRVTRMWTSTRERWLRENTVYVCHYCGVSLTRDTVTIDHKIPRSRAPELRNEFSNLVPCCFICNGLKGSVTHDDYVHTCH